MTNYSTQRAQRVSRKPAPERLREIAEVSIDLLITYGYADFRLADAAAHLGLTEAAIYRHVEGKDALVHLAFVVALQSRIPPEGPRSPVRFPGRSETAREIERFLEEHSPLRQLRNVLARRGGSLEPQAEFSSLVRLLYQSLTKYRRAIRLIERVAQEWPELRACWFEGSRARFFLELQAFIARRMRQGALARLATPANAAAVIVETVNYFAITRHYERYPMSFEEASLEDAVVTILTAGFSATA